MTRKALSLMTLSLSVFALGAVGCSNGSSPTEPVNLDEPVIAKDSLSSVTEESRGRGRGGRGGGGSDDDGSAESGRRGRGSDDGNADDGGRRGRRGRGGDDDNDNRRGRRGRGGNNNRPDDNSGQRPGRVGQEFEGSVIAVEGNALILSGGTRVIVNGNTQWIARGDLHNLGEVSRAVSAGRPVRAEGRGPGQGNGTIVAQTLKVEVDD